MYIDTEDYLADMLFIQEKIRIKFKSEYSKDDTRYLIITASCKSKDWSKAEAALNRLPAKMIITGNVNYEDFCGYIMNMLESERTRL